MQVVTQFLHLSVREGMLMTMGQVNDLLHLELVRRGLTEEG